MVKFILNQTPVNDDLQFNTEKKFIFVHIPKTGGSIFENKLKLGSGHATLRHYFISEYYSSLMNKQKYNIFIIVRNPYQRLISTYLNLMRSKNNIFVEKELNLLDDTSNFKKFIKSLHKYYDLDQKLSFNTYYPIIKCVPQIEFFYLDNNKTLIDKNNVNIIYFETYKNDIDNLKKEYNFLHDLKDINNNNKIYNLSDYYDNEILKLVNIIYKKDFEFLGYNILSSIN